MDFDLNKTFHGFCLKNKEKVKEIDSLAYLFQHEKTGAELLVLENDDDNKVFSVTFKTLPENDKGVAHILEHSVLCGSQKFPVKEPFVELMKGSLQTFLNAMTFPDKTMYPVASRNQKDLFNLMDVYLDAVFFPKITKETFMQEGWHYEITKKDEPISYKGVVFNEMKGVFSSPDNILDRALAHSIFPETVYGFESGGDPVSIPDLSYEEFKQFHEKNYHPSNSRIFLYGDGDIPAYLEFLDKNYLNRFERLNSRAEISMQSEFPAPREKEIAFPVSKDESLDKKTFVTVGYKLGLATDREHCLAMNVLDHILLGTSASPLRKALMESELGSEVIGGGFDDNRLETIFAVGLKGAEKTDAKKIIELIDTVLAGLAKDGIDPDVILSSVNTVEFRLREANFGGFAKGIVYNIQSLASWLYDSDPLIHLKYEDLLKEIKQKMADRYFEKLIETHFLSNGHRSILVMHPDSELAEKEESLVQETLDSVRSEMDDETIQVLIEKTNHLQKLQAEPDSDEALETLPLLALSDVNKESESFPIEKRNESSPTVLFHDLFTSKIVYAQMCFNTQDVPLDKIQYLPLLGTLILGMGTKNNDYTEISKKMGIHTGGISSSHHSTATLGNHRSVLSHIILSGRALYEKTDMLFELFSEIIHDRSFDNSKRLIELIRSTKSAVEGSIIPHGNQYVLSRLQSYQSPLGLYDEMTDGLTYFRFLESLEKRVMDDPDSVASEFGEVADRVFNRDNWTVNITSDDEGYTQVDKNMPDLAKKFPDRERDSFAYDYPIVDKNEAFQTASTVQYVGKGANLYDLGFKYSGSFEVLKSLLRTGFLWDRVRVMGGAYGAQVSFDMFSGDFNFVSYRDPNLTQTLDVYDAVPGFLKELDLSKKDLEKIIIGSVGRLDPPLTSDRKGAISRLEYWTGMTDEFKKERKAQLLETTIKDIKNFTGLFEEIKSSGKVCVLGNETLIEKEKSKFDHVVKVFH